MYTQNCNHLSCLNQSNSTFNVNYYHKKLFFTVLFSLYLALSLFRFIVQGDSPVLYLTLLGLGLFALILLSIRIKEGYLPIYIFVGFLVISIFVSSYFVSRTGMKPYLPIFFILSSMGISMILLKGFVYSWGGYIVFYGLAFYFIILMLTGTNADSAITTSFNGVSLLMLVACITLYIILSQENKKINLIPALCTLVISIWGTGRSGIASSIVLLLGLLFFRIRAKKIFILSIISFSIITYLFQDALLEFLLGQSLSRNAANYFLMQLMSDGPSERGTMWTNYFDNLDIYRVIFGVNVLKDPWPEGSLNDYNYHNSFINLHLQTGIMGLFTMALIIFALIKYYRTNKVFFFLVLVIVLRWSTDLGMFFHAFDFMPFFFIFYFLKSITLKKGFFSKPSIGRYLDISRFKDYQQTKHDLHYEGNVKL